MQAACTSSFWSSQSCACGSNYGRVGHRCWYERHGGALRFELRSSEELYLEQYTQGAAMFWYCTLMRRSRCRLASTSRHSMVFSSPMDSYLLSCASLCKDSTIHKCGLHQVRYICLGTQDSEHRAALHHKL
ncbi:hypothetical protein B0H12DRAFT_121666 [Mycena haematopus]|nr:hypothetical protein B0H12DRAFT_121666 [Mycena haematopus]